MTEPSARVVADSISPLGHRVTTMEVVCHRYVLAEFNTHRVFSRNSASSRAIPFAKQVERVETSPAVPVLWPAEQKGMQGGDEIEQNETAEYFWLKARDRALDNAKNLADLGVHKSVVNRLLEPFMYHTIVVTSTSWKNFFGLRCNPMAQPEIRVVADLMAEAYDASEPRFIDYGMWHLPYIDTEDIRAAEKHVYDFVASAMTKSMVRSTLIKMSSARCARVSYLTQDGRRSVEDDIALYDRLTSADPMHASPLEHPCTPTDRVHNVEVVALGTDIAKKLVLPSYGNLLGWHQHRFDVEVLADYQAFA